MTKTATHLDIRPKQDSPLVSDDLLIDMANPGYDAARGEFDVETRAVLAHALPMMARELRAHRQIQAASGPDGTLCHAVHTAAADQMLTRARAIIRAPNPIPPRALMAACNTLILHSRDATERAAALDVMDQMRSNTGAA